MLSRIIEIKNELLDWFPMSTNADFQNFYLIFVEVTNLTAIMSIQLL